MKREREREKFVYIRPSNSCCWMLGERSRDALKFFCLSLHPMLLLCDGYALDIVEALLFIFIEHCV